MFNEERLKIFQSEMISILILLLIASTFTYSQINLKINPDIIVKTNTGGSIKVTGDLIEAGSGYFKGLITSGQRTNVTAFAGLSLNPGLDGSINRVTGESYSEGNGEQPNFKRYYEINNTNGSDITTNMEMECIMSGNYDESNSITAPYHIYGYSTEWTGYGDGSTNSPIVANYVSIPTDLSDWIIADNSGIVSVEKPEQIPDKFELFQNYPNPFNPSTVIKYAIPSISSSPLGKGRTEVGFVSIKVYDILGNEVATLVNKEKQPGYHKVTFDASHLSSGTYIYKITTNNFVEIKKMLFLK